METIQGNERLFGAEDVFFSTTDLKGVIRNANQTFLTLARHPREEMIGAPHNIIRHDDMPAGVFKLMWDDIQAGRPVCAYVLNRAGDGRDYWVFATVTAIEDGYVSVRTKPLDDGTFAAAREVYGRVRAIEREAAEQGVPRRQVAEKGAEVLLAELAALGFPSLSAFSVASLPTEAVLLIDEGVRVPVRHGMEGPAATILGGARDIERDSDTLVGQMGGYRSLLDGLGAWMEEAPAIIERARRTGELVSMFDSQDPESSVPAVAARVAERTAHAVEQLTGLTETVSSLYRAVQAVPVVSITREIVPPPSTREDRTGRRPVIRSVVNDDRGGAALATEHILSLGHTRVVHIRLPRPLPYEERVRGYREVMKAGALPPRSVPAPITVEGAMRVARQELSRTPPPTAFFCGNDVQALGVLDAVADLGLVAGREVSDMCTTSTWASWRRRSTWSSTATANW